jgi:predicted nucleic acid-binding protein
LTLAVLDASTFILGLWGEQPAAESWIERVYARSVTALAPDLVHAEVANALVLEHRVTGVPLDAVAFVLDRLLALPLSVVPLDALAASALQTAIARDLSVYDACYAVLAEANAAPLITADRKLAAACAGAELITDA